MSRGVKPALMGLLLVATSPFWVTNDSVAGKISIRMTGDQPNPAEIKPALSRLLKTCRGIMKYQSDIETIKGRTDKATDNHVESDYGWKQWVSFEIKVKDSPDEIPGDWHANGQNLPYAVGPDGIDVGNPVAARFCDAAEKPGLIKTK